MAACLSLCSLLILSATPLVGQSGMGRLRGVVRDSSNGETLPDVNVIIAEAGTGAVTDLNGYYVIHNIREGSYQVVMSLLGYGKLQGQVEVGAGQTTTFDASLEPDAVEMDGVVTTAERISQKKDISISSQSLDTRQLRQVPALAEADLFRSLQMLPGVMAQNDFFSQLYVRGSSPDQNLILLDGVTVYNPYHLGGIFSTFNVDAVKEAELHLGGFPAQYGGRLASVLNVVNKDGNNKEMEGIAEISPLSSKLSLEGPSPGGSWMCSARRTYFDRILPIFHREFPYYFYDVHGKINYALSPNNRLVLSGLWGRDVLDYEGDDGDETENVDLTWGNRTVGLTWQSIIGTRLISKVMLSWTSFTLDMEVEEDEHLIMENRIHDTSLQGDWTFLASGSHELQWGTLLRDYSFSYLVSADQNIGLDDATHPGECDVYFQDQWRPSPLLSILPGLRLSYFNLGEFWRMSPRLQVQYHVTDELVVNGAWGMYEQYLKTFNDEELFVPMEMWFADAQRNPGKAFHYVAGAERWFWTGISLKVEGYYKDLRDILAVNREFTDEDDFFFVGKGEAYGLEVLGKKTAGKVNGWIGYSYAHTKKEVNGEAFYTKYDRRHSLNAVFDYRFSDKWDLNMQWVWGTGLPYSRIIGRYEHREYSFWSDDWYDSEWKHIEGTKHGFRYPTYNRLDMSLARTFTFNAWDLQMYVQVINVMNAKNVLWYTFNYDVSPSKRKEVTMFPILPTLGFRANF